MFRKLLAVGAVCALALTTSACGNLASFGSWTATQLSTSTPTTVNSVKAANDAFTLLAQGADTYVVSAHPSAAVIHQIESCRVNLKNALDVINADNAAGKSPVYDAFNEALKAWLAYNASKGVVS